MPKRKAILALSLSLLMLSGCTSSAYDEGYEAGYNDGYSEAERSVYDAAYEEGYDTGYSDAEYEFYDSRFVTGYEAGYSDGVSGKEHSAAPRGEDYVWFSFIDPEVVYHKYTLPLPACATAQTTDGFTELLEDVPYWEPDISPCPICFPEQ